MRKLAARSGLLGVLLAFSARAGAVPLACVHSTVTLGEHGKEVYWKIAVPRRSRSLNAADTVPVALSLQSLWRPVRRSQADLEGNSLKILSAGNDVTLRMLSLRCCGSKFIPAMHRAVLMPRAASKIRSVTIANQPSAGSVNATAAHGARAFPVGSPAFFTLAPAAESAGFSAGCGTVDYREYRATSDRITHSQFDSAAYPCPAVFVRASVASPSPGVCRAVILAPQNASGGTPAIISDANVAPQRGRAHPAAAEGLSAWLSFPHSCFSLSRNRCHPASTAWLLMMYLRLRIPYPSSADPGRRSASVRHFHKSRRTFECRQTP